MKGIARFAPALALGCTAVLPFDDLSGKPPNPSSAYHFDAPSGASAVDATGARPAALFGDPTLPSFSPNGKRGGGLDFTAGGWLTIPALSAGSFPRRATVAMWIFVRALPAPDDDWIEFFLADEEEDDDGQDAEPAPMLVYLTQTGQIFFDRGRQPDVRRISGPVVSVGAWHFVAAGWDIDRGAAVLFVRPDGRAPTVAHGDFPPGFALSNPDFLISAWGGALDELRYFDRMLTDVELGQLD